VRTSLFNTKLTRRYPDGRSEVEDISTPAGLAGVLGDAFGIEAPVDAETLFAKLPSA
jgi:hypothetical protein